MAAEQAKIKLHWLNDMRANSILWLLETLAVPYEVAVYHHKADKLWPPELAAVHPLGKAPVVTITPPGSEEPVVLAETGFIIQYLCDHFAQGKGLVPARWKEGREGTLLGETEAWMRYSYLLHYVEGSLNLTLRLFIAMSAVRKGKHVPLLVWPFVRPFTSLIAIPTIGLVVFPHLKKHLAFLEQQLATSGGDFMTGAALTAADMMLSYPLLVGAGEFDVMDDMGMWPNGSARASFPKLFAYMARLEGNAGYQAAVAKTKELDGSV